MATNYARADYQEIIDLHTESDKVSLIGIHTPTGIKPRQMLDGFFRQFRKFRYSGCDLVMVPAARLPADPLGVSYEAGEPGSDPRDLLNPILFHGCHGDSLNSALNSIYKGTFGHESSAVGLDEYSDITTPDNGLTWEQHYYRALSDPTFKKSNVMSAIRKKGLRPLVYNVATDKQIAPTSVHPGIGDTEVVVDSASKYHIGLVPETEGSVSNGGAGTVQINPRFFTNRLQSLGWFDTWQVFNGEVADSTPGGTLLPKVFMAMLMLPLHTRPRCTLGSY